MSSINITEPACPWCGVKDVKFEVVKNDSSMQEYECGTIRRVENGAKVSTRQSVSCAHNIRQREVTAKRWRGLGKNRGEV